MTQTPWPPKTLWPPQPPRRAQTPRLPNIGWGAIAIALSFTLSGCNLESVGETLNQWLPSSETASPDPAIPDPESSHTAAPAPSPEASPVASPAASPATSPTLSAEEVQALYQSALDKGYSAATLAQSAEAPSDWEFVALRWQAAIADLQTIPAGTPPHATAQTKIGQYQQGLNYAQQQAKNPAAPPPQIVARSEPAPTNSPTPNLEELPPPNGELITQVPIRGRVSGIPVVDVTINGQAFPMMLDTGASGTVLTQGMAQQLALASTGTVQVNTPSHQGITMPTARLSAISVGSITVGNLEVIVSPSMDVGLLGQNFFGGYDVTIRQDRVEFHSRG